jgi:hypothetical protein
VSNISSANKLTGLYVYFQNNNLLCWLSYLLFIRFIANHKYLYTISHTCLAFEKQRGDKIAVSALVILQRILKVDQNFCSIGLIDVTRRKFGIYPTK